MNTVATSPHPSLVNQNKLRVIACFVLLLTGGYLLTLSIYLLIFLVIDFALRAFNFNKYSPLATISGWLVTTFNLPVVMVYFPPKRFAARVGLVFCCTLLILQLTGINTYIVASMLALFSALESLLGFCAGCYVYDFLQKIKRHMYKQ